MCLDWFVGCLNLVSVVCGCAVACGFDVLLRSCNVSLGFALAWIGLFMLFRLLVFGLVCFAFC